MPNSAQAPAASATEKTSGFIFWLSRLRSYFFWDPLIWIYTIILGTLSLVSSLLDRDGSIQHRFARLWSRMILRTIGARILVDGLEKLDLSTARVYAVNHLSALDIPVLYQSLPFQFRILAKKELFRYPFMGWHLRRSGQIPIDLDNTRSSVRSLNRAVDAIRNNTPLVIFPEGGRAEDGQLQPFMGGAFYLAVKAQVPVVPMALVGTYEMLPMNTWHIRPRQLKLLVAQPVPTSGLTLRDVDALTQQVRTVIGDLYYSHSPLPDRRNQHLES